MNIGQIRVASWTAAGLLTLGLSAYVWSFVSTLEDRTKLPSADHVRQTLSAVEPVVVKNEGQVQYADVKRLFHDLNWTGIPKAPPKPVDETPADQKPEVVPVKDLVRVVFVQDDLADPKSSIVGIQYRPKAGVTNKPGRAAELREGDTLASPHDHIRIDSITALEVRFTFADPNREPEMVGPTEYDAKAEIVVVGPDGVVLPPPKMGIRRSESTYVPGKTTPLGTNRFLMGTDDMTEAGERYTEILSELDLGQHRDPRTGRYDGIEVRNVPPGSFADRHGVQDGDVIKSINGHPVNSTQEAISYVKLNKDKYSVWEVVIENKGKTRTVTYESPGH